MGVRRPKSNKNPPIFSHEFVIQNHADIVSCVAMVFVIGLMFQVTSPVASLFIAMSHNVTLNETETEEYEPMSHYTYGRKDLFSIFFYSLICVVVHAVVQEYVLDKLNRRMHLSKVKHSKFNESGQLLFFYFVSAAWGIDIITRENFLLNINSLWEGYPHNSIPFIQKFFFIIQVSYWIHSYPELYFQKVKKDEMPARIQYATLYLVTISIAYCLNFTRVTLLLLVLHYTVEMTFHLARLLYFSNMEDAAKIAFTLWNGLFVIVRLGSITLAVLTFWYGLAKSGISSIDFATGNFNTQLVRINCLAAVCILQAWMMWSYIMFQLSRRREAQKNTPAPVVARKPAASPKAKKDKKRGKSDEGSEIRTEENGSAVRQRTPRARRS